MGKEGRGILMEAKGDRQRQKGSKRETGGRRKTLISDKTMIVGRKVRTYAL